MISHYCELHDYRPMTFCNLLALVITTSVWHVMYAQQTNLLLHRAYNPKPSTRDFSEKKRKENEQNCRDVSDLASILAIHSVDALAVSPCSDTVGLYWCHRTSTWSQTAKWSHRTLACTFKHSRTFLRRLLNTKSTSRTVKNKRGDLSTTLRNSSAYL